MAAGFVFPQSDMTLAQAQNVWTGLRKGIVQIQNGNASSLRYEELYRNAYTLVLHKYGGLLHDGVIQLIQQNLDETAKTKIDVASDAQLIYVLLAEWNNHKLVMTMIRDVLMYMDKTYCEREGRTVIYQTGVGLFCKTIIKRPSCRDRIESVLLGNIQRERDNKPIEQDLVKHCLFMLIECGNSCSVQENLYELLFEKTFLEETRRFYKQESAYFITNSSVPEYLRKVEQRLKEEEARADKYLFCETRGRLRAVCQEELIIQYAQQLIDDSNSGCQIMFQNNSVDDLQRLYTLFTRCPDTINLISHCLRSAVRNAGDQIVRDQENNKDPHKFVQSCLDLRSRYFHIVQTSFGGDRSFAKCLKESFEYFINLDSRAAYYLAQYIDHMLKKNLRGCSEDETESKLEEIITIFRYILDKDVFEEFYKLHLSNRLLSKAHISDGVEKSMIAKLKAESGHQCTSKLEGMFKNIELSAEINQEYQTLATVPAEDKQISVNVLTSGFWPFSETKPCKLPASVEKSCQSFATYYKSKYTGHKIFWQTSLGTAEMNAKFDAGRKELIVHTYQMCILMLFNDADSLIYDDILNLTDIPENDLQRHLLSLAHPKVKVLLKDPNTKAIHRNHVFSYNVNYTSNLFRVKIPLLQAPSTQPGGISPTAALGSTTVPSAVIEARKNRVDASIVRILKARQTIEHSLLIAEVHKQLQTRFSADPALIKRRIEALIERDYLERDKNDRRTYNYLA